MRVCMVRRYVLVYMNRKCFLFFAALTFFPALALGPIAEHLSIWLPV